MPNINATSQSSSYDDTPVAWTKMKDLEVGRKYPVVSSWQMTNNFGDKDKLEVKVRVADTKDNHLAFTGNADLFAKLFDSHVKSQDEGYSITVTEHQEYKGHTVCKVIMEQEPKDSTPEGDDLPF